MKVRNFERFFLKTLRWSSIVHSRPFLSLRKIRMRIIFDHVVESGHFVSRTVRRRLTVSSSACLRVRYAHSVKLRLKVCYILVSAVQGLCCFCILSVTCSLTHALPHRARAICKNSHPCALFLITWTLFFSLEICTGIH